MISCVDVRRGGTWLFRLDDGALFQRHIRWPHNAIYICISKCVKIFNICYFGACI